MKARRREFLKALSSGVAARLVGGAPPARKPNVFILMADRHRVGLTRRSGFPFDTMPALDRLAARGVAFERAYTTAPLCDATVAPIRHGAQGRSLWPLLRAKEYPCDEFATIYAEVGFGGMNYQDGDKFPPGAGELFNLSVDPYELKNLYDQTDCAAMQNRLMADLLQWTIRTQDDLPDAAYEAKRPQRNWYAPYKQ